MLNDLINKYELKTHEPFNSTHELILNSKRYLPLIGKVLEKLTITPSATATPSIYLTVIAYIEKYKLQDKYRGWKFSDVLIDIVHNFVFDEELEKSNISMYCKDCSEIIEIYTYLYYNKNDRIILDYANKLNYWKFWELLSVKDIKVLDLLVEEKVPPEVIQSRYLLHMPYDKVKSIISSQISTLECDKSEEVTSIENIKSLMILNNRLYVNDRMVRTLEDNDKVHIPGIGDISTEAKSYTFLMISNKVVSILYAYDVTFHFYSDDNPNEYIYIFASRDAGQIQIEKSKIIITNTDTEFLKDCLVLKDCDAKSLSDIQDMDIEVIDLPQDGYTYLVPSIIRTFLSDEEIVLEV